MVSHMTRTVFVTILNTELVYQTEELSHITHNHIAWFMNGTHFGTDDTIHYIFFAGLFVLL